MSFCRTGGEDFVTPEQAWGRCLLFAVFIPSSLMAAGPLANTQAFESYHSFPQLSIRKWTQTVLK